jgi:hypothetical protein
MADFNYLLGAQTPQLDVGSIAQRQASLAYLLQQTQLGNLQLQMQQGALNAWSDPETMRAMMPMLQNLSPGQLRAIGPGMGILGPQLLGMYKTQAETQAQLAAAAENRQKAHDAQVADVGNQFDRFSDKPSYEAYESGWSKVQNYGLQNEFPNLPDPRGASPDQMLNAAATITGTTRDVRSQIAQRQAETRYRDASTGLLTPEYQLKVQQNALKWADFLHGKMIHDENRDVYYVEYPTQDAQGNWTTKMVLASTLPNSPIAGDVAPKAMPAPGTGPPPNVSFGMGDRGLGISPTANVNMRNATAANLQGIANDIGGGSVPPPGPAVPQQQPPAAGGGPGTPAVAGAAPGGGVAAPTPPAVAPPGTYSYPEKEKQKGQIGIGIDEQKQATASAQASWQTKQYIDDLRRMDAQGIFSGGIEGTPFFRTLANVLAPFLTPEYRDKLANTQAWTADTGNLIATAVRAFVGSGGRVAARELDFFKGVKPETLNQPETRQAIYQNIWKMADKLQQIPGLMTDYQQANPNDYALSKFIAQPKDNPMPHLQLNAPPPAPSCICAGWRDANGKLYTSNGRDWLDRNGLPWQER